MLVLRAGVTRLTRSLRQIDLKAAQAQAMQGHPLPVGFELCAAQ